MSQSYWTTVLEKRLSRRRAMLATGALAGGVALSAACGGGDSGEEATGDKSGLLTRVQDSSAKAVPGGTWQTMTDNDALTLDPHVNSSSPGFENISPTYDHLVKYGRGTGGANGPIAGDAVESWEMAPDGLTLTMKVRPNHKFDPRPPTSGRAMTAEDIKWSWDRTVSLSPFAVDVSNVKAQTSPVTSVTAADARTVVMKFAFPYGSILQALAHNTYFYVMPVEADGKFDPRNETRGSGPFTLEKWTPSTNFELKKKAGWYEDGRPFLDGINRTIIRDYSAALAQFESGNIWDFQVQQQDILRVKRDHPAMILQQDAVDTGGGGGGHYIVLSQQASSPLKDVRVRRAASMLIDRDLWISTIYNTDVFSKEGLPVEVRWNTCITGDCPEWLDPKGRELGEGAQYFQYNPTEAQKLLTAAGYDKKLALSHFYQTNNLRYTPVNEVLNGMLREGFTLDYRVLDYQTEWREVCQRSGGMGFNGFCYNTASGFNAENYLSSKYTPEGKFKMSTEPIPVITDMARKIKGEVDAAKQTELIKQIQREAAMAMPDLMLPGYSLGFRLSQPWLQNFGAYTGLPSARLYVDYWYDATKKA